MANNGDLSDRTHESVKDYYGHVLKRSTDLKTSACCSPEAESQQISDILQLISAEVRDTFYGCGSPIPPAIDGCTVLDLGCGSGRDSFICAKLVGENGYVIGVDMTENQLAVARRHEAEHAKCFGYAKPNTSFRLGYMEDLSALDIADNSVDVAISNCVINLTPDKAKVFAEVFRVLKPGGELFFSDVFVDRRLPESCLRDPVLVGECLAGAMYGEDFRRTLLSLGVADFRIVRQRPLSVTDESVRSRLGPAQFRSVTLRVFKLDSLEDRCEDYGQVATYLGGISQAEHAFLLDDHHEFIKHKPMLVCGNTASMVSETRFDRYFDLRGDRTHHFGLFSCGPAADVLCRPVTDVSHEEPITKDDNARCC